MKYRIQSFRSSSRIFLTAVIAFLTLAFQAQAQTAAENARLVELFNQAGSLLAKGDGAQAAEKYTEAIAIVPTSPIPYLNRGTAYASFGKLTEAVADADKALSLLGNGLHPPKYSAVAYIVKGSVAQSRGELQSAVDAFSKAIEFDQTEAKSWNNRGNAYLQLKQFAEARKDYDKAIELDPTVALFWVNRASVNLRLKDHTASLKDVEEALRLDKSNDSGYYTRGNLYTEQQKYDLALADYNQAIALKPRALYFYGRGRLYLVSGKFDLAVKDNTDALALDPKNALALGNRAVAYTRLRKFGPAADDVRLALELSPNSAWLRYNLAYLLYQNAQYSLALDEATKVIASAPKWRDPYIVRSNAYVKLGNQVKAKADRDAAAKLGPGGRPVENVSSFEFTIFLPEETNQ
jgi:tetratricopeptide (TPR) repeat protein